MSETPAPDSLAGTLGDSPLPEVLRKIRSGCRTGTLSLVQPGEEIQLFFEAGELRTAISTAEGRRLGDALRKRGVISEEDLASAIAAFQAEGQGRLGKYLLRHDLITEDALRTATQAHFREIVSSAFEWTEGRFSFRDSTGRLDPDVALPLSLPGALVAGIRRIPESERFIHLLGDLDRFARRAPWSFEGEDAVILEPAEAYVLSLCDGKSTLRSILKLSTPRLGAARSLYALEIAGLLEFLPEAYREPPADSASPPEAGEVWSATAEPDPDARAQLARTNYLESRRRLEKRDYYGAIVLLQESVRLMPENSEYHFRLAGALSKNARWRVRAGHHYGQAFVLDPARQEVMREYAEFLAECGRFSEGRAVAQRLVQRYPDDPRNVEALARCERGLGAEGSTASEDAEADEANPRRSLISRLLGRRDS